MERIICAVIGYVFGLFQTGYLYGKLNAVDIREHGSGNAGATNVMRTLGKKAGAITYAGDTLKAILVTVVIHFIFGNTHKDIELLLILYGGVGVILGHNFPFYLKFKGGKGIATTSGVILSLIPYNWIFAIAGFFTFVITALLTRYVSAASLAVVTGFLIEFIILGNLEELNVAYEVLNETYILVFLIAILAYIRHSANIKRLLNGTERKIGQKKDTAEQ